jgi:hypothetical protein
MKKIQRYLVALGLLVGAWWPATAPPVFASSNRATLATFAGTYFGHTRSLKVSRSGRATESIGDGCCHQVIGLSLRLSRPRGTLHSATVLARVTRVRVSDRRAAGSEGSVPRVRDQRRIRLRLGIVTEPITRTNYCDRAADLTGACGA